MGVMIFNVGKSSPQRLLAIGNLRLAKFMLSVNLQSCVPSPATSILALFDLLIYLGVLPWVGTTYFSVAIV